METNTSNCLKAIEKTKTVILPDETEQQIENPEAEQRKIKDMGGKIPEITIKQEEKQTELTCNQEHINGKSLQSENLEFARAEITEGTEREVEN